MMPPSCEAPVLCACALTITRPEAALFEFQRMASLTEERFKQLVEYPIPSPPESSEIRFSKNLNLTACVYICIHVAQAN